MKKTLLYHSIDSQELAVTISLTLNELSEDGLINKLDDSIYAASTLGEAVVASSLTPEDGLFVHRELLKALQAFAIVSDMHALYTFYTGTRSSGKRQRKWFPTLSAVVQLHFVGNLNLNTADLVAVADISARSRAFGREQHEGS